MQYVSSFVLLLIPSSGPRSVQSWNVLLSSDKKIAKFIPLFCGGNGARIDMKWLVIDIRSALDTWTDFDIATECQHDSGVKSLLRTLENVTPLRVAGPHKYKKWIRSCFIQVPDTQTDEGADKVPCICEYCQKEFRFVRIDMLQCVLTSCRNVASLNIAESIQEKSLMNVTWTAAWRHLHRYLFTNEAILILLRERPIISIVEHMPGKNLISVIGKDVWWALPTYLQFHNWSFLILSSQVVFLDMVWFMQYTSVWSEGQGDVPKKPDADGTMPLDSDPNENRDKSPRIRGNVISAGTVNTYNFREGERVHQSSRDLSHSNSTAYNSKRGWTNGRNHWGEEVQVKEHCLVFYNRSPLEVTIVRSMTPTSRLALSSLNLKQLITRTAKAPK